MQSFNNVFFFNFNQTYSFIQNTYTQPIFNNSFNYSNYNTQSYKTDYSFQPTQTFSFNPTPISIGDFYSSSTTSQLNTPIARQTRITSSSIATNSSSSVVTKKKTTTTQTSTKKTGLLRDYNADKGSKLAEVAMHNAGYVIDSNTKKITSQTKDPDEFTSYCTRYVKAAIRDAGLGDYYGAGSAYQMTSYLRNNDNFKEIASSTPLKDIPAGSILVYDRGVAGYSSEHGHIEIKTDDGRAVSDGITDNLYKRPSHIFMPV
jgi:hypothetical protein